MPRGGRRPGAGAPKGNTNALKHGRRSRRLNEFAAQLAASPAVRKILLSLADREKIQEREADRIAAHMIEQVLARGLKRGRERLIVLPPLDDGPTIEKTRTKPQSSQRDQGHKVGKRPPHNQSLDAETSAQSENG